MQQAERVGRQYRFSIEGRSNSLRTLRRPVKPSPRVIESQPADLEKTTASQESFEEGIQLELLSDELSRQEFLRDDAFPATENIPGFLSDALRQYASNQSVKGLAIIAGEGRNGGFLIKVIREPSAEETDADRIRLSVTGINLMMNNGGSEWVGMHGKPFDDVEKDIKDEVSQTPGVILAGIFKFTD